MTDTITLPRATFILVLEALERSNPNPGSSNHHRVCRAIGALVRAQQQANTKSLDLTDVTARALGVSRGTAQDMLRETLEDLYGKSNADVGIINALKAAVEQKTEPVAWGMAQKDGLILDVICPDEHESYEGEYTIPLYTAPPQRSPLTDEEIRSMCKESWVFETVKQWVRIIEAAHGIQ